MKNVKALANRLGYSVNHLAELVGYSKQGLHYALGNHSKTGTNRLRVIVKVLKAEIEKDYQRDVQALEARHMDRLAAVEELLYFPGEGGEQ